MGLGKLKNQLRIFAQFSDFFCLILIFAPWKCFLLPAYQTPSVAGTTSIIITIFLSKIVDFAVGEEEKFG